MPIVRVSMFEGRSLEKKRRLIRGITAVVAEVCEVSEEGIHVLIDEMTRENWGRGGIPNVDRPRVARETAGFFSVSDIVVFPEHADEYLAYRRDRVNPTMAGMPGFFASIIARDLADPYHYLLFNGWGKEADWRAYQGTGAHDALKHTIRGGLTRSMEIERYAPADLPHGNGLDAPSSVSRFMTVSTHSVRAGEVGRYLELRRTTVNPGMAALAGFCSSTILARAGGEDGGEDGGAGDFLIVNQWESREHARAYGDSTLHDGFKVEVRSLLDRHSGTREYETVPL